MARSGREHLAEQRAARALLPKLPKLARFEVVRPIDDLQWAGPDSLALLTEILRPPAPRFHTFLDSHHVGVVEGIFWHFGYKATILVSRRSLTAATFACTWVRRESI